MHRQTGLNMALKPFHILEKEKRHQLYREISALQACALDACDHLIKLYDAFFDDEYVYMVLEYMNGGSLRHGTRQPIRLLDARVCAASRHSLELLCRFRRDWLNRVPAIPETPLAHIGLQIFIGLDFLHKVRLDTLCRTHDCTNINNNTIRREATIHMAASM